MPGKDLTRWTQNNDGTWTRIIGETEETTAYNPNATAGALAAAEEQGVDINAVTGTGKDGKITKADVDNAAAEQEA